MLKMEILNFLIFLLLSSCNPAKSKLPGQIKFILGRCVPHDEYMNAIDLGRCQRSSEVHRGQTLKILVIQLSP